MMQKFSLNGRQVAPEMHAHAVSLKQRGARVFVLIGPEQQQGCTNCNGHGSFHIEYVAGGPYEAVPPTVSTYDPGIKKDVHIYASQLDDGHWYQMKMKGYKCPICGGVSQAEATAIINPTAPNLDALVSNMRIG